MRIRGTNVSRPLAAAVVGALAAWGLAGLGHQPPATPEVTPPPAAPKVDAQVLDFTIADIDGKDVDLAQWKGKVVMIVNTASKCGYTKQYHALEALYQANKDKGFVVLAFPSGDFANQEYADNAAIKTFCTGEGSEYKVTFPLFGRLSVKGEGAHPLFKKLAAQPSPIGGEPKWNFTKWLVDRDGNVVDRFEFRMSPSSEDVEKRVGDLLAAKPKAATVPMTPIEPAPK